MNAGVSESVRSTGKKYEIGLYEKVAQYFLVWEQLKVCLEMSLFLFVVLQVDYW